MQKIYKCQYSLKLMGNIYKNGFHVSSPGQSGFTASSQWNYYYIYFSIYTFDNNA